VLPRLSCLFPLGLFSLVSSLAAHAKKLCLCPAPRVLPLYRPHKEHVPRYRPKRPQHLHCRPRRWGFAVVLLRGSKTQDTHRAPTVTAILHFSAPASRPEYQAESPYEYSPTVTLHPAQRMRISFFLFFSFFFSCLKSATAKLYCVVGGRIDSFLTAFSPPLSRPKILPSRRRRRAVPVRSSSLASVPQLATRYC
jgi:hypothetical protein